MIKVSLALVTSVNGKLTNAGVPSYVWASQEDQTAFEKMKNASNVIIMGRHTYESAKSLITLSPKTLRVVMTSQPEKYEGDAVMGQLAFSQLPPKKLLKNLMNSGYTSVLLVGGAKLAQDFLEEGLVTQLYLTIEPLYFSQGLSWDSSDHVFDKKLTLKKVQRLNKKGTLLLTYLVKK
jgi:dihydrofolate reductase